MIGLYIKSHEVSFMKMHPLVLDGSTYTNKTSIAIHTGEESFDLNPFVNILSSFGAGPIETQYNGSFPGLLGMYPHMAAFNINVLTAEEFMVVAMYNDTFTHSLPVIVNLLTNALFK